MSMTASVSVTKAGLISVVGGTNAPEATLGPYEMIQFADDARPVREKFSFVLSPLGGNITFNISLEHRKIPVDWALWSHNYKGDVYWTGDNGEYAGMTLPSGTSAFYFYAEPKDTGVNTITAIAYDGVSDIVTVSQEIDSIGGASYFGFYGINGSVIRNIMVYSENADFAIGEFGISTIPAPGAVLLGSIGIGIIGFLRKRHQLV